VGLLENRLQGVRNGFYAIIDCSDDRYFHRLPTQSIICVSP
jgi:hypothetical protein